MPIYNGIEFISDSVGSIIKQTYNDWELIIGINGHPQNSDVYKIAKYFEIKLDGKIQNKTANLKTIKIYRLRKQINIHIIDI